MDKQRIPLLPEYVTAKDVEWQLFATFTFYSEASAYYHGDGMFNAVVGRIAKLQDVYHERVLWMRRLENGDSGDHWHFHAVIGGLGELKPHVAREADAKWRKLRGDFARVVAYDPALGGLAYILQQTKDYGRSIRVSADDLEIPTPSRSLLRLVRSRNAKRDGALRTRS